MNGYTLAGALVGQAGLMLVAIGLMTHIGAIGFTAVLVCVAACVLSAIGVARSTR